MTTLNINVGVLGHVDSGKTSLSKALSAIGSTAAFDKNPQSQARGITLDLGFSAFNVNVEEKSDFTAAGVSNLQFTLVDCPGHASLIRTVLGGAQIIDLMMLVIDVTKGIQTQTAECIVVGEILSRRLVVVLNKIDAVQGNTDADKDAALKKMIKKLRATFAKTRWPDAPFIQVAANPGAGDGAGAKPPIGVDVLTRHLTDIAVRDLQRGQLVVPVRSGGPAAAQKAAAKNLLMLVDHCFAIKGQGTVMTGTVLQGRVAVGDEVHLPDYQLTKKVKGIQMFKKAVTEAVKGDRIGMCVSQFSADQMERGVVCGVGGHAIVSIRTCIARVHKVRFHGMNVVPGLKYHITVGHSTVMGTLRFFARAAPTSELTTTFDFGSPYDAIEDLPETSQWQFAEKGASAFAEDHLAIAPAATEYYAALLLEQPVTTYVGASIIVSRLDTDVNAHTCRIAVHGTILTSELKHEMFPSTFHREDEAWRMLEVIRPKRKLITVDRVLDDRSCISKSITQDSHNQDPARFIGAKIALRKFKVGAAGEADTPLGDPVPGVIQAPFGSSGKVKLQFEGNVFEKQQAGGTRTRGRRGGRRGGRGRRGKAAEGAGGAAAAAADDGSESGSDDADEAEPPTPTQPQAKPAAAPDAAEKPKPPPQSQGPAVRTRIEIELAYKKRPFATHHRFA